MKRLVVTLTFVALVLPLVQGCNKRRELLEDNELLFAQAEEQIARRRFTEAIRSLGDVGLITPVSQELDPKIKLALADAYFYQSGNVALIEAQSRYEQFLSFYPTHPEAERARYMVGLCLFRQAESPENDQEFTLRALTHFQSMFLDLPANSPWRIPVRQQLMRAQDRLAQHEWQVARFYRKKDKRLGEIGRLNTLVDLYPDSSLREEAFILLAEAHLAVDDVEQARLALDRAMSEYPDGDLAQRARELRDQVEKRAFEESTADEG